MLRFASNTAVRCETADAELDTQLRQIASADRNALEQLYRSTQASVYGFAYFEEHP